MVDSGRFEISAELEDELVDLVLQGKTEEHRLTIDHVCRRVMVIATEIVVVVVTAMVVVCGAGSGSGSESTTASACCTQ